MSLVVTDTNWAVHEFADADLGDERRTTRLVELAYALGQHPTAALPEACGTGSMLKAAYRFFDNDGIAPQDILQSHVEATYTRLGAVSVVLAVQDTTEVNWTRHPATQGLGPLGHTACHGLLVHTTLAITPERVPLGLLAQQVWARDPADVGKRARRKQLPISQKESQKWLHSLDAVYTAHDCCPTTRLVSVGDREADVYDVLAAPRPAGVDLLIRAAWDRCVQGAERYVWATVTAQPVGAHLQLKVPRRGPQAARAWYASEEGRQRYQCRAGVEGTLSQGVRAFGLRRTRYRGLEKTHLQHVAIAAAINIDRIVAWLEERPRATTRTSRFAALAPVHDLPSETPAV